MNKRLWHYDLLESWQLKYYKDVILYTNLTGEELAIGKEDERLFYYTAVKNDVKYLIPSKIIEEGTIPFLILDTKKVGVKGKAYQLIINYQDVSIKAVKTMTYKEMINNWMDFDHKEKEKYILWKIITDTAYNSRINIRVTTHPGWMKDSPMFTLSRLKGNCFAVNQPSFAKMKYLLNGTTKILGLNEIQKIDAQKIADLTKFYVDMGDFKTMFINPSRGNSGAQEMCTTQNISTMTFSNFPSSRLEYDNQREEIFDYLFHPKVNSRIMPLLFTGGSENNPACEERFSHITTPLTTEEQDKITEWIRNYTHYSEFGEGIANQKLFTNKYYLKNTRWDRNFQAICHRIKLYCDTQEEYDYWTKLLYCCHQDYLTFLESFNNGQTRLSEETILSTKEKLLFLFKTKESLSLEQIEEYMKPVKVGDLLDKLCKEGEIFCVKPGYWRIL